MLPALVPDDSADYDMWVRTLVAYKNGEIRGVSDSTLVTLPPSLIVGQPSFDLMVYGDSTDTSSEITFK